MIQIGQIALKTFVMRRSRMKQEKTTYCRLCEANCGLLATVEDDRVIAVRGNPAHIVSQGFFCVKAQGMVDVTNDPDRLVQPLRRTGSAGQFEPCSWEEALSDIAARLDDIRERHGPEVIAVQSGNPAYHSMAALMFFPMLQNALGARFSYNINSEDAASRFMASHLLYNNITLLPRPDLWRSSFAIRSEEHTSDLQSLMRISYAVFC